MVRLCYTNEMSAINLSHVKWLIRVIITVNYPDRFLEQRTNATSEQFLLQALKTQVQKENF